MRVAQVLVQDEDAAAINEDFGFLSMHEGSPVSAGDYVVIPSHSGYTANRDPFFRTGEHWFLRGYQWLSTGGSGMALVPRWTYESGWIPVDQSLGSADVFVTNGYTQLLGPVIVGDHVYVPGPAGTLHVIGIKSGTLELVVDPFAGTPDAAFSGDARVIIDGAISVGTDGTAYYTATAWPLGDDVRVGQTQRGAWLVAIPPGAGSLPPSGARIRRWAELATAAVGVPQLRDLCDYPFGTGGTPPASGPTSRPPQFACGLQRPQLNAPIAVDPLTGTLVAVSGSNNAQGQIFEIEVDPATLSPIRANDLRGRSRHGCGVRLPITGTCAVITAGGTTNLGADPRVNGATRMIGQDIDDNAVSIMPDGRRWFGGYDGGFSFGGGYDARGFGVAFTRNGSFDRVDADYFWEVTRTAAADGSSYRSHADRNLYSAGDLSVAGYAPDNELLFSTSVALDPSAAAIDWLDAQPLLDVQGGQIYVNGTGHAYLVDRDGSLLDFVSLPSADGSIAALSMETLAGYHAWSKQRALIQYAGNVYVIESTGANGPGRAAPPAAISSSARAALAAGAAAKRTRATSAAVPPPADDVASPRWMLGQWQCATGFFGVPPFIASNHAGIYTLTEDEHGIVHGHYDDQATDLHDVALVDFDETWHIGSFPDANGVVPATYSMTATDGQSVTASGTVRGPFSNLLGTWSLLGTATLPDGSHRGWRASASGTTPTRMISNWRLQIGPSSFQGYWSMDCTPIQIQQ